MEAEEHPFFRYLEWTLGGLPYNSDLTIMLCAGHATARLIVGDTYSLWVAKGLLATPATQHLMRLLFPTASPGRHAAIIAKIVEGLNDPKVRLVAVGVNWPYGEVNAWAVRCGWRCMALPYV